MRSFVNCLIPFFKKYQFLIVGCILVGLLTGLPQVLSIHALGSDYQGIHFRFIDDEDNYMVVIKEVVEGKWLAGSPYFYEYKDRLPLVLPFGVYWYALPALFFGLSVSTVLIISKFVLPACLFAVVYFFVLELSEKEEWGIATKSNAALSGLLVTIGYELVDFTSALQVILGKTQQVTLSVWTRPVNPITGAILLFGLLLILLKIFRSESRVWLLVGGGLLLGLMTAYFFSWSAALTLVGVLLVYKLLKKEWKSARDIAYLLVISFLVSAPYWYSILHSLSTPGGGSVAARNGMFFTHTPIINRVVVTTGCVALLLLGVQRFWAGNFNFLKREWWKVVAGLMLTGVIVFNQQVITGRTIWPFHYVQYTIPLCYVILCVLFFNVVRPRFPRLWAGGAVVASVVCLLYGVQSVRTYVYALPAFRSQQEWASVFDWLNKTSDSSCVVLTAESPSGLLASAVASFTKCDVYAANWVFEGVPDSRIEHNYFTWLRLGGVSAEDVEQYLYEHRGEVRGYFFENWQQIFSLVPDNEYPVLVQRLVGRYQEFLQRDFAEELRLYRLDYIISDHSLDKKALHLPNLRLITMSGSLFVYTF